MCETIQVIYKINLEEINMNSDILSLGKVKCVNPKCNIEWYMFGNPSIILNNNLFVCKCGYRYYSGKSKEKSGKDYFKIYYNKSEKK